MRIYTQKRLTARLIAVKPLTERITMPQPANQLQSMQRDTRACDCANALNALHSAGFTHDATTRNPTTGQITARFSSNDGNIFYLQSDISS